MTTYVYVTVTYPNGHEQVIPWRTYSLDPLEEAIRTWDDYTFPAKEEYGFSGRRDAFTLDGNAWKYAWES